MPLQFSIYASENNVNNTLVNIVTADRRIFWIDAGVPSIGSSKLTGADRKVIHGPGNVARPVALCIDADRRRLYWSDRDFGTISTSDYEGDNVRYFRLPQSYASLIISLSVGRVSTYGEA